MNDQSAPLFPLPLWPGVTWHHQEGENWWWWNSDGRICRYTNGKLTLLIDLKEHEATFAPEGQSLEDIPIPESDSERVRPPVPGWATEAVPGAPFPLSILEWVAWLGAHPPEPDWKYELDAGQAIRTYQGGSYEEEAGVPEVGGGSI